MTRPCVLALGFFDGVHIGHGGLLRRTRETADRLGVPAAALTFDTHPDTLVSGHSVPLLNTPEDRAPSCGNITASMRCSRCILTARP